MPRFLSVGLVIFGLAAAVIIGVLLLPSQGREPNLASDAAPARGGVPTVAPASKPELPVASGSRSSPTVSPGSRDSRPAANESAQANAPSQAPGPSFPIALPSLPSVSSILPGNEPLTLLLLGVDREQGGISRADSIMVVRIDPRASEATVLSIPRDLYVPIHGGGVDRINAAYAIGTAAGGREAGADRLAKTLHANLGLEVDGYVAVDFDCFKEVIDSVGGVTVHVPRQIRTDQFRDANGQLREVIFPEGPNHLDGERALEFARTRYSDNDFARMGRQQAVLAALVERIKQRPDLLVHVARTASDCPGATTDMSATRLLAPARTAMSLSRDQVTFRTIDNKMVQDHVTPGGAMVLLPRWEPIRALVAEMFPS
jgi:polyisoprenyl-teichoic acid--peptidoglycan teichoic acid transferase